MGKIVKRFETVGDQGRGHAEFLLDSGASVSIIRRDVAVKLAKPQKVFEKRVLKKVDGKACVTISEEVLLHVRLKGKLLDNPFCVVDEMPREAIFGADFLQRWDIRLFPQRHDFEVGADPESLEMV